MRLLLVDDHPVVRAGYQRFLEQTDDIAVIAQAGDAGAAWEAFVRFDPDLTVTDLSLPGGSGLELLRRIRLRRADARVLVFSMYDTPMLVRRAFDVGAWGFLSKQSAPHCLLDAVHAIAAGRRYLSPPLPQALLERSLDHDRLDALTQREFEIFRLLARGESPLECARALNLSAKTVSNHQTAIKDKLGVATSAAMAHLALRHGVIAAGAG